MKWRLAAAITGAASALAVTGLAIAQSSWVTVTHADVQICRPIFKEAHRLEQELLLDQIDQGCARGASTYDADFCGATRDFLKATRAMDDVDWFMLGNETCSDSSAYPCFGPSVYNQPRTGRDAQRAIAQFREEASQQAKVTADMDFVDAAAEGDRCISQAWVATYDAAAGGAAGKLQANNQTPPASSGGKSSGGNKQPRGGAKSPEAPAPAPSSPSGRGVSVAAQADVDACIDGKSTQQKCASLLDRLQPGDPAYVDVALSLMAGEIDAGRPVAAIGYGDIIASQRSGADAELVRCTVRVLAKWDLNAGLMSCNAAGVEDDTRVMELRGQIHLLAGRWSEGWKDFDAAYNAAGEMQPLFLRGLSAAALGRTRDAQRDMDEAEENAPGTTKAFADLGYSLAAVKTGKPLAPPEAFGPGGSGTPADPAAPAPSAPPAPAPPAAAARVGVVKFAPDAPRGQVAPLTAGRVTECDAALRAIESESQGWKGTPEEIALRSGMIQRTLFAGRCAGHAQAASLFADGERTIAISAASAASAFTDAADTTPAQIDCVEPMIPTDPRNTTGTTALRNSCNFAVYVAYCNVSPAKGSWAEMFSCTMRSALALDVIPASGATPAVFGREVQHFACRKPAMPVLTYVAGKGLDGFCK
ncbi:MAG: hypothetical protein B7Y90_13405 [Alphaproteobacteria bacterium 32-64-14]|nr:MAG: hypothetical protein B7Y90_13405 [Alphaproteobacteria bacterium 32-64-14]